jgi:DNA-binding NarL/FixJ family response regulator
VNVARVVALVPDLLFGSRVQGALQRAGHEVELFGDEPSLRDRLRDSSAPAPAVLIVDLTSEDLDGASVVETLSGERRLTRIRTLGFYAHVDLRARQRAVQAGFDLIVPRSRMAREGEELVARMVAEGSGDGPTGPPPQA